MSKVKLLVIGLGGADLGLIREYALPFLSVFPVQKQMQPEIAMTAETWVSFYTGRTAKQHKVEGFRLDQLRKVKAPRFWEVFNAAGWSVGTINLPMTYPARKIDGFMISGIPSPAMITKGEMADLEKTSFCYPPELRNVLESYVIDVNDIVEARGGQIDPHYSVYHDWTADLAVEVCKKRRDNILRILASDFGAVDLLFVNFNVIDRLGHAYQGRWKLSGTPMKKAYLLADVVAWEVCAAAGYPPTIVISDHGFNSPAKSKTTLYVSELHEPDDWGQYTKEGIFFTQGVRPKFKGKKMAPARFLPYLMKVAGIEEKPEKTKDSPYWLSPEEARIIRERLKGLGYGNGK